MTLHITVREHWLSKTVNAVKNLLRLEKIKREGLLMTQKVKFSTTVIVSLADFVLSNYAQINDTIETGIKLTKQTYLNSKLTISLVHDLFKETAKHMQAVENQGGLTGAEKKKLVLEFITKEYIEVKTELKTVWSYWQQMVDSFIDQIIALLNAGRNVLPKFSTA